MGVLLDYKNSYMGMRMLQDAIEYIRTNDPTNEAGLTRYKNLLKILIKNGHSLAA